jgi:hypothetical protein
MLAQLIGLQLEHVMPGERHLSGGDAGGRFGQQASESEGGGAFAAAAFADEREGLACWSSRLMLLTAFKGAPSWRPNSIWRSRMRSSGASF